MPFGTPRYIVPKSGCNRSSEPMAAMIRVEFGSSGAFEMSWFQGLSGGKSCLPCRLAPGPRSGWRALVETMRGRVTGVGAGTPESDDLVISLDDARPDRA